MPQLLPFKVGLRRMAFSKSEYYRQAKLPPDDPKYDPLLPRIVKPLGKGSKPSALVEHEVDRYDAARIAERDEQAV